MEAKLKAIMAEIFVCNIDDINMHTLQEELENWDSLQHLILISRIEMDFNVKFTPDEISEMDNYTTIYNIIKNK